MNDFPKSLSAICHRFPWNCVCNGSLVRQMGLNFLSVPIWNQLMIRDPRRIGSMLWYRGKLMHLGVALCYNQTLGCYAMIDDASGVDWVGRWHDWESHAQLLHDQSKRVLRVGLRKFCVRITFPQTWTILIAYVHVQLCVFRYICHVYQLFNLLIVQFVVYYRYRSNRYMHACRIGNKACPKYNQFFQR